MNFLKYLRTWAFFAAGLLILTAGINWLVDPFGFLGGPRIENFNAKKTKVPAHEQMSAAIEIMQQKPKVLIMGTSRAQVGLAPTHPGFGARGAFGTTLKGGNMYAMFRYFQHAHALGSLDRVVFALDFFIFNAHRKPREGFREERLAVSADWQPNSMMQFSDQYKALFSIDAIKASVGTVLSQHEEIHPRIGKLLDDPPRKAFLSSEWQYLDNGWYEKSGLREFDFIDPKTGKKTFDYFREMVRTCYTEGIDLILLISPSHARHWATLYVAGLWPKFEQWKRELVRIIDEEAAAFPGTEPFTLWDFSGFNPYTTEDVPPFDSADVKMKWYWDSSHFRSELGDIVLDIVLRLAGSDSSKAKNFGKKLDPWNIEKHFRSTRRQMSEWRKTHRRDMDEIMEQAQRTGYAVSEISIPAPNAQ